MHSHKKNTVDSNADFLKLENLADEDIAMEENVGDDKKMEKSMINEDALKIKVDNEIGEVATNENDELTFSRYFEEINGIKQIEMENTRSNLNYKENVNSTSANESEGSVVTLWENKTNRMVEDSREDLTVKENETKVKINEIFDSVQFEESLTKENESSSLIKSEVHVVEKKMEVGYQDVDERVQRQFNPPSDKYMDMAMESNLIEETENNPAEKIEKNNESKSVGKPIVWDRIESNLKKKIKNHSRVEGVVAFSYHSNPFQGVKNFSISTFQDSVIKERCTRNWIKKLTYLVKKMNITHLFVQGFRQTFYLKKELNAHFERNGKKLDVYVFTLPKRDPLLKCPVCFRRSCSIFKVKHFFNSYYEYNIPIECYATK